jgi:uncharacterized protein (TIGR02147 family)
MAKPTNDLKATEQSLFQFQDYKAYLRFKISENRLYKAYQSKLAEKMGCQRSFLSQVLNSHVQLTPDHASGLAEFWGLSQDETSFFTDLVLLARAAKPAWKEVIKSRMKRLKEKQETPTDRFEWPTLSSKGEEVYYSSWYWSAVHIAVSISRFKSAVEIAEHLRIPQPTVEHALKWLEQQKLVRKTKLGWDVSETQIYLPKSSPMVEMHHFNWRQRALDNIQRQDRASLHYSAVFALSESDFHKLKENIVSFLESANEVIGPSRAEELVCFNCDFFKV